MAQLSRIVFESRMTPTIVDRFHGGPCRGKARARLLPHGGSGVDRAQVFLRRTRLRALRRDLPAARVLPDAHRRPSCSRTQRREIAARRGTGPPVRRPRRGRLRQGEAVAAVPRCRRATSRSTSRLTRSRSRSSAWRRIFRTSRWSGVATDFSRALDLDGVLEDSPATLLLSRVQHREFLARPRRASFSRASIATAPRGRAVPC